uniref:Galectin n=1 Tax=Caenorhabditis elegans TaxID=6239 RepID=Q21057_CAEEL|nr:galectin [Caenorhabditis elegans]
MIGGGIGISFCNEFFNPQTPVNIPVQGFSNGARLRLVLLPTSADSRFHINLRTPDDIVLHFNARFDEGAVVNNSTSGGGWQSEDRHANPFQQNKIYTLEFVSNGGIISIFVNGAHFADFVERTPSHGVHLIEIEGGVHVHSAHVSH